MPGAAAGPTSFTPPRRFSGTNWAIVAGALAVAWVSWGQPNQIGLWTYVILWCMRLSAKFNLFLGVRNLGEEFLPDHMKYLGGFLRRKPMNLLFPFSVTLSTVICVWLAQKALATQATPFEVAGYMLLTTLLFLAILEHWMLVLPVPVTALWQWALNARGTRRRSAADLGTDVSSWSTYLSGACDRDELQKLLDALAVGSFGGVERVKGITQTGSGWIKFDLAGGRCSIAAFAPGDHEQPRVVAIGREIDEDRLKSAFDACIAPAAVPGQ